MVQRPTLEEWVRPRGVAATAWTGLVVARAPRLWYLAGQRVYVFVYIQGVPNRHLRAMI